MWSSRVGGFPNHLEDVKASWRTYWTETRPHLFLRYVALDRRCVEYLHYKLDELLVRGLTSAMAPREITLECVHFHEHDGAADRMVAFWHKCAHLKYVKLESTEFEQASTRVVAVLLQGLAGLASLRRLDVHDVDLTVARVGEALSQVLGHAQNCHLQTLHMFGPTTRAFLEPFVAGIAANRSLETLSWTGGSFSDASVQLLGEALLQRSTQQQQHANNNNNNTDDNNNDHVRCGGGGLRHLALRKNRLTHLSLPLMAQLLNHLPQLESLDLFWNLNLLQTAAVTDDDEDEEFDDNEAHQSPAATEMLSSPRQRRYSKMAARRAFCRALEQHGRLKTLNILHCSVDPKMMMGIFHALETNVVLQTLDTGLPYEWQHHQHQRQQQQQQQLREQQELSLLWQSTKTTPAVAAVVSDQAASSSSLAPPLSSLPLWLTSLSNWQGLRDLNIPESLAITDQFVHALRRNQSLEILRHGTEDVVNPQAQFYLRRNRVVHHVQVILQRQRRNCCVDSSQKQQRDHHTTAAAVGQLKKDDNYPTCWEKSKQQQQQQQGPTTNNNVSSIPVGLWPHILAHWQQPPYLLPQARRSKLCSFGNSSATTSLQQLPPHLWAGAASTAYYLVLQEYAVQWATTTTTTTTAAVVVVNNNNT